MQPEIIKYKIVTGDDIKEVEKEINNLIGDNWQPHGSLCTNYDADLGGGITIMHQAMIKYSAIKTIDGCFIKQE